MKQWPGTVLPPYGTIDYCKINSMHMCNLRVPFWWQNLRHAVHVPHICRKREVNESFEFWNLQDVFKAVVLHSSPRDLLLCTFCMPPLFNTPDSDHQLTRRETHELNWVCQIKGTYQMCRAKGPGDWSWEPLFYSKVTSYMSKDQGNFVFSVHEYIINKTNIN